MSPKFFVGVKIADRVPIIIFAIPDFAFNHASARSLSVKAECKTTISVSKRVENLAMV